MALLQRGAATQRGTRMCRSSKGQWCRGQETGHQRARQYVRHPGQFPSMPALHNCVPTFANIRTQLFPFRKPRLKRREYCLGEMTVGSLPAPPRMPLFFTHVSTCLSHVYCGGGRGAKQRCFLASRQSRLRRLPTAQCFAPRATRSRSIRVRSDWIRGNMHASTLQQHRISSSARKWRQ